MQIQRIQMNCLKSLATEVVKAAQKTAVHLLTGSLDIRSTKRNEKSALRILMLYLSEVEAISPPTSGRINSSAQRMFSNSFIIESFRTM